MSLQWRYQLKSGVWSDWQSGMESVMSMAADPDYCTGRVQERTAPPRNEVVIERIEQEHGKARW